MSRSPPDADGGAGAREAEGRGGYACGGAGVGWAVGGEEGGGDGDLWGAGGGEEGFWVSLFFGGGVFGVCFPRRWG